MIKIEQTDDALLDPRVSTGVSGLDDILAGGLMANRLYLIEGQPGAGKTTLALQFLLAGRARGESGLYVTLSETEEELHAVARSHGITLDGIALFEFASTKNAMSAGHDQTLLHPWEVELGETIKLITDKVEATSPTLVVFDSLSEMRLLAQDPLRYRRQILALKQFFAGRNTTVLLLDDMTASAERDLQLHSLCHGVITLERLSQQFGPARRRIEVQKMRGVRFRAGFHDFKIEHGGLVVLSAPGGARASSPVRRRSRTERHRRARCASRRRPPPGHQHADHRSRRVGQDDARPAICRCRLPARRAGGAV